uniref:Transposase n=1 Tax=Steinernema glaseri TaxID=37863 RepID=A0A1I7ZFK5_9BILA
MSKANFLKERRRDLKGTGKWVRGTTTGHRSEDDNAYIVSSSCCRRLAIGRLSADQINQSLIYSHDRACGKGIQRHR